MSHEYYDNPAHVDAYIKKCEGLEYPWMYEALAAHLPEGKALLELGMGPGNDLAHLTSHYQVTGSDLSLAFIAHARARFPALDFLQLDAVQIETDSRFDCIFSNKVLHLLTRAELKASLIRQRAILLEDGLIAHSFWIGEGQTEEMKGMSYIYHEKAALLIMIGEQFDVLHTHVYEEFSPEDSLFLIAKKRPA